MRSAALLAIYLCICTPVSPQNYWTQLRDDLTEYLLDRSVAGVRSSVECTTLAQTQHQAVDFAGASSTCRMFICQFGRNGCRKCRNANNYSLPLLMVRHVDQLGHSCWRTFQHRVDGSVDFYRNWTDYLGPFGQGENLNYWMGLEAIHQLTAAGDRRVRWEMSMWNGSRFWWEDLFFAVQGASTGYRVTIGDQDVNSSNVIRCPTSFLSFMNNKQFSTADMDQDTDGGMNCASNFLGSWWYGNCHCFNPNGKYYTPPAALNLIGNAVATGLTFETTIRVYPFDQSYSMQNFECMVADAA